MKRLTSLFLILCFIVNNSVISANCASIYLNKTKMSMYIGQSKRLNIYGTKKKASWSSSNKKIATVTSNGLVKGRKRGSVNIIAKVGRKKLTCKVTVKKMMSSSSSSVKIKNINKGKSIYITCKKSASVKYKISNSNIASCKWASQWNGNKIKLTIYGKKKGTTYIYITNSYNSEKIKIKVKVTAKEDDITIYASNRLYVYEKYGDRLESIYTLNNVAYSTTYEYADTYSVDLYFSGEKTNSGINVDQYAPIRITWELYEDGYFVTSDIVETPSLASGDKFKVKCEPYFYFKKSSTYTLRIVNTT